MMVTLLFSCENKMSEVNALARFDSLPGVHTFEMELIQTDSGFISFRLITPEVKAYSNIERPYVEFPLGAIVYGYDTHQNIQSSISANYARHYEDDQLWIAENDVVAINNQEGNQLNTEYMVWDMKKKIIYSHKFSRITTKDGVFYGKNGFEADEVFSKWKLINTEGTFNVNDE